MFPKSLKVKVSIYLTVVLVVVMVFFILLLVRQERNEQLRILIGHMTQLSQVIERSTRYAMLLDEPDIVDKIIEDIGKQDGIKRVRVLDKSGMIAHSNYPDEIGDHIDKKAEHCTVCHEGKKALSDIPNHKKWRLFETEGRHQMLGNMEVIRNEPSCSGADCHKHPKSQSVLGVVDITYSLDEVDRTMRAHMVNMVVISIGFIFLVSLSVGWLLHRLIYVPLRDLENGARRLATGDFDHSIPVRGDDEFGSLALYTNQMTAALKKSRGELEEWVQTLEHKVKERTQELRRAEAEVARGEKLASIGKLAAGIAHELNNPLTGVLTFTSLLRKKMPEGSQDAEDLDLVIRETKRCASIIRRLLDFAREKTPEKKLADLNQIVRETVQFVERSAALQQIDIAMELDPGLPQLLVDADLIKQVVMNILVNAQQAIEERGHIVVQSRLHAGKRLSAFGDAPVPAVEIAITDNGCGIPEANMQRIFDPFFTSKEVGKGTGLGLSVSYGIVKSHGGEIEVESKVGEGTTFRIYLPARAPVAEAESKPLESMQ
ncbi:MAG TPA: ATP-binding protein [Noviherbaspirillum sp.]|uniref:sensor histidine kinase n=1 Tax=Noviherbaspirillum sp. TaxID=1926288 RepID=UPI002B476479|nr:ATP-binding protein [Noviherbaspirillum sp.]HJV88410.1 ATP-binding protein [Noviherbaspirillum sp.]